MDDTTKAGDCNQMRGNGQRSQARVAGAAHRPLHARAASTPDGRRLSHSSSPVIVSERTPLARSWSTADIEGTGESMEYTGGPVAGGTIMGIHNLAIVFPQFIVRKQHLTAFTPRLQWSRPSFSNGQMETSR
jgi:hypothetical protein